MFDKLIESSGRKRYATRRSYFCVVAVVWSMLLASGIASGILAYDARLGESLKADMLVAPVPAAQSKERGPRRFYKRIGKETDASANHMDLLSARPPAFRAAQAPPSFDAADITGAVARGGSIGAGGVPGGDHLGAIDGAAFGDPLSSIAPPPPPKVAPFKPAPQPEPQAPVIARRPSAVLQGSAIRRVEPLYPSLAKAAGVRGQVVVEVIVDESGNVISARALSGHPLLKSACVSAAREWKWRPTLLNGMPIKVTGTITFNFQF